MQIAILAGGLAIRLGELTRERPKSMLEICGKPFLEYQIEMLRKEKMTDVILCLGHLGGQIKRYFGNGSSYGVSIQYSIEDKPLGTAGALKKAEPLLDDPFFTLYGDSFIFLNFSQVMAYFKTQNKLALMTVYRNHNQYDKSNTAIDGNMVTRFVKKDESEDMPYIEYGANILTKKALEIIPGRQSYSLDDLFVNLVEKKELLAFEVIERFYEIGSLNGLKDFQHYAGGRK